MHFDQNMIIDATRGSIARFVNHSCEPNCKMVKWTVAGKPRMALFAGDKGIMTGDELTYDYNFEWVQGISHAGLVMLIVPCQPFLCQERTGMPVRFDNLSRILRAPAQRAQAQRAQANAHKCSQSSKACQAKVSGDHGWRSKHHRKVYEEAQDCQSQVH